MTDYVQIHSPKRFALKLIASEEQTNKWKGGIINASTSSLRDQQFLTTCPCLPHA